MEKLSSSIKSMDGTESKRIPNAVDQEQLMDVDKAWEKNRFDQVLRLLLKDSHFPKNFRIDVLQNNDSNEDARKLIDFYEIRRGIHQLIIIDNLVGLKSLITGNESKFYLNCKNESAVFTAVKNKKFKICAFLMSIGAGFKDENEENMLKSLTLSEKTTIQNYLPSYIKRHPDAHILYLLSKSSSLRLRNDFQKKVKKFYEDLDRIPEMYQIFQVIQHADFLDLVFDFDKDDISYISPTNSANEKGLANYKEGRLYIAAGKNRSDRDVLGTIAHELTHMAMELIYGNECNPYYEHDENRKMNYEKIVDKELLWSKSYKSEKMTEEVEIASKIISDTFSCYSEQDHHSELIARVPQILAQVENGKQLLMQDHADLYKYFNVIITKDFKNFAAQSDNLKVKRQIRSTNESLGEIKKVRGYPLSFNDVSKIQQVLTSKTEKIFVVVGESSWLCVIKTLQGIYGSDYVNSDRYLVFKIQNFLTQPEQILTNFKAGGTDLLVIECPNEDDENLNIDIEKIGLIHDLFMCNENKKIVFAVHCDFEWKIKSILNECRFKFVYFNDSFLSLCNLRPYSQKKILKKEILFQKKRRSIIDLIEQDDKIKDLVDTKTVDELIGNEKIKIGSEDYGLADLDGAYANLQEEIDTKVLADVLSDSKKKFFVFEGFKRIEDLQSAVEKLSLSNNENLQKTLLSLEKENCIKIENVYSDEKFKNLCKSNAAKDVYWIQFQAEKNGLFLRKLYTPNFYLKRNFVVYNKLVVQIQEIVKCRNNTILISNTNEEQFRITLAKIAQRNEQQNDEFRNKNRRKASTPHNFHNIKFAETENEAQNIFDDHIRDSHSPIYWLKMEGDEFVYVRSSGNLSNLRKNIDIENTKKCLVSENDVIENLEHNNPIIIADDPGMGKSTTIIKLVENKTFSAKYWTLKVNLKEFSTWIKNTDILLMVDTLIEYLSQFSSKSGKNVARLLLKSAIYNDYNFPIPIFIFFDGFDEISEETDKNKIMSLLQYLKSKTKVKFLITTRVHCKNTLEDSLGQLAWEFEPMDDATKGTFIKSYMKIRLNLTLEKKLLQEGPISFYTTKFLEKMASIFKVDLARFIGTPLQLYLLLEDTLKHFKDWAKQQSKNFTDPDFSFFGNNLMEIYSNFLDKKYDYCKQVKKKSSEYSFEDIKLTCENSHMELAEILTRNVPKKPTLVTGTVLDCGIVKYQDNNFKFIHPTFQEYYASKVFMKWIEQEEFSSEENLDFICRNVLLKRDYHIVRCFLNDMFTEIKRRKIAPGNFEYFKNVLKSYKNHRMVASSLHVLVQEEHAKIFDFFTSLMTRTKFLNITCRFSDPLLIYACRCNRKEIVECILKKYDQKCVKNQDEILCKRGQSNETCLHHAAFYNNTEIVKLILDKAWEKCSLEQFYAFVEIKDDNGNTALHLSASCLGQFFADINEEFMKTHFRNPLLSDFYAKYQWQYKYWFPEMPYELLSKNIYQVLFHRYLAAEDRLILLSFKQYMSNNFDRFLPNASNVFELILSRLPEEKAASMTCATDASGCNSLHYAVANKDVNLIQKISDKISPTLLSALINTTISNKRQGDSAIDITFNRDDANTFQFLLGLIPSKYIFQTLSATKNDGFNILHNSVKFGKTHFLRVILNNLEKAICLERENILLLKTADPTMDYNTLHLAALYDQPSVAELLLQHAKDTSETFLFNYLVSVTESNCDADALNIAVSKKNIKMAELLLNAIPEERLYEAFMPDNGKKNALHTAALCGDSEATKLILQKLDLKLSRKEILTILMSVTRSGQTAMQSAILKNHVSVVAVLLEYSIKNSFDWEYEFLTRNQPCNVIHFAIFKNYSETVKLIVDKIEGKKLNQILNISSEGSIDTFLNSVGTEKNNKLLELIYQKLSQSDICQNRSFSGNNKQESRKPKVAMYRK